MKKVLFFFAFAAISVFVAQAQVANFSETTFFKAKYKKENVWDVQRAPAYPIAGRTWTLSGLQSAFDASRTKIDWGNDRYLMLVPELDNANGANSFINDVTKSGGKYKVSLQLFESNGTLVKVLSKWGKIAGIGDKGFMYEEEGQYGIFFTVAAVPSTTIISYNPTLAVISKMSELVNPSDLTRSLERSSGITEGSFFTAKYSKENVWDVQRMPAYPLAGKVWTLSGLKGALDNAGMQIDWGKGRYLMLVAEVDNTKNANSLIDDINNVGTRQNISLKLYESDGRLVKVISKWGKLYGRGDKGFMYEIEGRYGVFFSVALVNSTSVINYTPSLATITKLTELVNSSDLTAGIENEARKRPGFRKVNLLPAENRSVVNTTNNNKTVTATVLPKVIKPVVASTSQSSGNSIIKTKFGKDQVWHLTELLNAPAEGTVKTMTVNERACKVVGDGDLKMIDWGQNGDRYMMVAITPKPAGEFSEGDPEISIAVNLYEKNGTLAETVFYEGVIIGIGDKGFEFQKSGGLALYFSFNPIKQNDNVSNRISTSFLKKMNQVK